MAMSKVDLGRMPGVRHTDELWAPRLRWSETAGTGAPSASEAAATGTASQPVDSGCGGLPEPGVSKPAQLALTAWRTMRDGP